MPQHHGMAVDYTNPFGPNRLPFAGQHRAPKGHLFGHRSEQHGVEIRRYDIIYKVTDDIRAMLEGRLKPEERIVELGHAVVKQVFSVSKLGSIAGCYVVQGNIERGCRIRVNRDGRTIGDYPLDSLRRVKDDVKEVARGFECGIKLSGFNDVKQDDVLEAYRIEEVARTLS